MVWIPSLLRGLTGGQTSVYAEGRTVGEVIDAIEIRFPGIKGRLCDGDRLRSNISVIVDGKVSHLRLRQSVNENSEIHFVQAISGGTSPKLSMEGDSHQTG